MTLLRKISFITGLLAAFVIQAEGAFDPYENINRKIFTFNQAFDATMLKPLAIGYKKILPAPVRAGINNAYDNVNMIPTVFNDLLQAEWQFALKDTWRFIANTTIGLAGIFDVAKDMGLPPRSNDLGITFAKWGDTHSPYMVIPFLGPSTYRDAMGLMFNYTFLTPYPYIPSDSVIYGLLSLRYIDIRSQMLENEGLINEGFDKYTFIRDAYLQHRNYQIIGAAQEDSTTLYVAE